MPLDAEFIKTAYQYYNPYTLSSGTEHVGMLLYSLARMTRPRVIVEYGSGHSTLFVLRALADNVRDVAEERAALLDKTRDLKDVRLPEDGKFGPELSTRLYNWLKSGNKACAINPGFFLPPYLPHLYSFEALTEDHEYVSKMRAAVERIGHNDNFTYLTGQSFNINALPLEHQVIDWAWNDDSDHREFFSEFWPALNPKGGLMIFHGAVSDRDHFEAIQWMKQQRSGADKNDLEILFLEEPHKLTQNGCAILRKTTAYAPSFHLSNERKIYSDLMEFVRSEDPK